MKLIFFFPNLLPSAPSTFCPSQFLPDRLCWKLKKKWVRGHFPSAQTLFQPNPRSQNACSTTSFIYCSSRVLQSGLFGTEPCIVWHRTLWTRNLSSISFKVSKRAVSWCSCFFAFANSSENAIICLSPCNTHASLRSESLATTGPTFED